MYHTSPIANLTASFANGASLCLADDLAVCQSYLRGGDVIHYTYEADWTSANIADESDLASLVAGLGMDMDDRFDGQPYRAMKNAKVRAAVLAAGYDGVSYEDTHEGCNYTTTELLRAPEGFALRLHSTVGG